MFLIGFGTGFGFTAINIAGLQGTRKGEEGLASGLINTSRQIGGPIGLAVLLTVANFATPYPTGQLIQSSSGNGNRVWSRFFGSCTTNWDWNYLCVFIEATKTTTK